MITSIPVKGPLVTIAHISSESGDHDLVWFEGALDRDDVAQSVYEMNPDWWEDPDMVWVQNLAVLRVEP